MRIAIKLLGMLKKCLPRGDGTLEFQPLDLPENSTVDELLKNLGVPRDVPLLIILNDRESHGEIALKEGDRLIVSPPIYGG